MGTAYDHITLDLELRRIFIARWFTDLAYNLKPIANPDVVSLAFEVQGKKTKHDSLFPRCILIVSLSRDRRNILKTLSFSQQRSWDWGFGLISYRSMLHLWSLQSVRRSFLLTWQNSSALRSAGGEGLYSVFQFNYHIYNHTPPHSRLLCYTVHILNITIKYVHPVACVWVSSLEGCLGLEKEKCSGASGE